MSNVAVMGICFESRKPSAEVPCLSSQQQTGSVSNIRGVGHFWLWCVAGQPGGRRGVTDRFIVELQEPGPSWAPVGVPHGTVHEACHFKTMD